MSSFKTNRLIFAIGALIIGIILLIWPGASLMIIGRCIGAVLAAGGIVAAFLFWKDHEAMSRTLLLVMAAVMLICGIVIILHPDELVKLIPTIMGVLAVMSGLINIGETFLLNRKKYGKWWISLIVAALKIAAGVFVIRNAFSLVSIITRLAGGVMVFSGCSDLWVLSRLAYAEKKASEPADAPAAGTAPAAGDAAAADATPAPADAAPVNTVAADAAPAPADAVNAPAAPVAAAPGPDAPADAAPANTVAADAAPADAVNAPAAPMAAAPEPDVPADAAPANTVAADAAPAPAAPEDIANEPDAPADAAAAGTEPHAEDFRNVSPSLVWDDEGTEAGQAEVPEYMRQEEQPGDYKAPEEDT